MRGAGYREALLVYIDILGFRKLIETSATDPSAVPTILATLRLLKKQTSEGGRVVREEGNQRPTSIFRAFNFSDLTVRATFIDTSTNYIDILKWEFLYLSGIQVTLTCEFNILLRGGISIGQISMEPDIAIADDILFGPALVRSYELESKAAIWPRLIIDSPVIQEAKQHPRSLWPEYYCKDGDGQFFVDYLFGAAINGLLFIGGKPLSPVATLQKHKNSVERKINALVDKEAKILEKLRWLVSYHNGVVRRLQRLHSKGPDPFDVFNWQPPEIPDSLLISDDMLGVRPTLAED
jgi:hypothetical protein